MRASDLAFPQVRPTASVNFAFYNTNTKASDSLRRFASIPRAYENLALLDLLWIGAW